MFYKQILSLLAVILFTNALFAEPILNITQPIRNIKVTNTQMKEAIERAAQAQNWAVTPLKDGQLSASYHKSDYMAKINIDYSSNYYTITYSDSYRMRYRTTSIHPTYNKLIKALQANIVMNLKTGNFSSKAVEVEAKEMVSPVVKSDDKLKEDIVTKLKKLKQLNDGGLITDEEYALKRKSIIDAY